MNERDGAGRTPLIAVTEGGHSDEYAEEIVKILLAAGANLRAKDAFGHTAAQIARENHQKRPLALLER